MFNKLFKQPTPDELFRKWRQSIRAQERTLDRQIRQMEQEENKAKKLIKQVHKRRDEKSCRIIAKEIVRARKHKDQLYTSKAQLNSIVMQLQEQTAMVKVVGSLQKSAQVMKLVNNLIKLPEISRSMMEFSKELTKAGIIEEMVEDSLEVLDGVDDDVEEEAEEEVSKVLREITDGLLGQAGSVSSELNTPVSPQTDEIAEEEVEPQLDEMQARLSALRS